MDIHSCHLLFDHFQFALIHGPDIPGSYTILLFTASDLASITSHSHNWVLFLLWLHPFILSGVISPLISSSILGTYWPGEFLFRYPIILPFHTLHFLHIQPRKIANNRKKNQPTIIPNQRSQIKYCIELFFYNACLLFSCELKYRNIYQYCIWFICTDTIICTVYLILFICTCIISVPSQIIILYLGYTYCYSFPNIALWYIITSCFLT